MRQRMLRSTKDGKICCRQRFQDCLPARFAYPMQNGSKKGFRICSRGKRLRFCQLLSD
jgi:hypothetical protein